MKQRWIYILIVVIIIIFGGGLYYFYFFNQSKEVSNVVSSHVTPPKKEEVRASKIEESTSAPQTLEPKKEEIEVRKKELGLSKSIDVVLKPGEQAEIKGTVINPHEVVKQKEIEEGKIIEEKLSSGDNSSQNKEEELYGIHVVRKGENLWNIHFGLIKDYLASQGIKIPDNADEPYENGRSSGVGKLLKFAENMVLVYNIKQKKSRRNINIIHPGEEVVIFKINSIFKMLKGIDFKQLDYIVFDGRRIYLKKHN